MGAPNHLQVQTTMTGNIPGTRHMNVTTVLEHGDVTPPTGNTSKWQLYRKPHDVEIIDYDSKQWQYGGDGYRAGKVRGAVLSSPENPSQSPMPEVYRANPDHQSLMQCPWQEWWRDINPDIPEGKVITLMDYKLAWMNGTGVPVRWTCLENGEPDYEGQKMVAYHAAILNGGALLKGVEAYRIVQALQDTYNVIIGRKGWAALRRALFNSNTFYIDHPPISVDPSVDPHTAITNPDYFHLWQWGTTVTKTGQVNLITRVGHDGKNHPVRIPLTFAQPIHVPLSWLHKLPQENGRTPIPAANWMAG